MVLVKANGYGHGDIEMAHLLQNYGVDYLGVAFVYEGVKLKKTGIKTPIFVFTPELENFDEIIKYELEPSIVNAESAMLMAKAIKKAGLDSYPIHIKLDTGMQRVGFEQNTINNLKDILEEYPSLHVKSIFSHLAAADEEMHDKFTREQIASFHSLYNTITSYLPYKPIRHILNTAGLERFPEAQMDMVRLGIGVYGISPTGNKDLKPVASFVSQIISLKKVTGGSVGYGRAGVVADKEKIIATIPLGYADGVNRHLSKGNASFIVNGKPVPTIGNICMDSFMLDITGVDAKLGDEVLIFGEALSVSDLAKILGTIPYEVLTSVSARVERILVD